MSARHVREMFRVTATLYEFCSSRSRYCSEFLRVVLLYTKPDFNLQFCNLKSHGSTNQKGKESKQRNPLGHHHYHQIPCCSRDKLSAVIEMSLRLKSRLIMTYDNDSNRVVFIFRNWFDSLDVVLEFSSFILKMFKAFQILNTGLKISQALKTFWKFIRSYSELPSNFGQVRLG